MLSLTLGEYLKCYNRAIRKPCNDFPVNTFVIVVYVFIAQCTEILLFWQITHYMQFTNKKNAAIFFPEPTVFFFLFQYFSIIHYFTFLWIWPKYVLEIAPFKYKILIIYILGGWKKIVLIILALEDRLLFLAPLWHERDFSLFNHQLSKTDGDLEEKDHQIISGLVSGDFSYYRIVN